MTQAVEASFPSSVEYVQFVGPRCVSEIIPSSCGGGAEVKKCGEILLLEKLLMRPQVKNAQHSNRPCLKCVGKVSVIPVFYVLSVGTGQPACRGHQHQRQRTQTRFTV